MAKSIEAALDSSLDDMISANKGGGKGKKQRGAKGKGKGKQAAVGAPNKVKKTQQKQKAPQAAKAPAKEKAQLGTAKALDMSLEDIVKAQTKGKKQSWGKEGKDAAQTAGAKAPGKKKLWGGAAKVVNRSKGEGKGKGAAGKKEKWNSKGEGQKGWGKGGKGSWGKGGGKKQWVEKADWEDWAPKKNSQKEAWRPQKKWQDEDDWAPKKKEWVSKGDSWGGRQEKGGGRGNDSWGGRGNDRWEPPAWERRREPPAWAPSPKDSWVRKEINERAERAWGPPKDRDDRPRPRELKDKGDSWRDSDRSQGPWKRALGGEASRTAPPRKRAREEEAPAGPGRAATSKNIKVTNIPRDLDMQDIKDAFEAEAGRIAHCEMQRGTARIEFYNAKDARKAVDTFDRGELNGKTIEVVFER